MKRKGESRFLLAIVAVALLGISIGYAIISRNFDFTGTINVKGNTWSIVNGTISEPVMTGDAVSTSAPEATTNDNGEITINYNVSLNKPGDTYSFVVPIENNGSIDAILETITNPDLGTAANSLEYKVELVDEDATTTLEENTKLATGDTINVKISLAYKNLNNDSLANVDINKTLVTTLHFVQDVK